jgi:hypothetical protein
MKKLVFLTLCLFFISNVYAISWSGGTINIINQTIIGNLTIINGNLSDLGDVNISNKSDDDILSYNLTQDRWIGRTFESLNNIWQRIGNIISPKNSGDNLDISDGGGNVTANFFFGNLSQATGLDNKFLFTNGSNSEPILNISPNALAVQDIYADRINNSGEVRIGGRVIIGGEPSQVGILEESGVGISGGPLVVNDTTLIFSEPNGLGLSVTEASTFAQIEQRLTNSGSFDADNNIFCDTNDPFTIDDKFKTIGLFNLSDFSVIFVSEISDLINSSCVVWKPQVRPNIQLSDISPISYILSNSPILNVYDNSATLFTHVGKNAEHIINFKNTSEENFKLDFIGSEKDQTLSQSLADVNGQLGFTNARFFTESDEDVNDTVTHGVISEVDLSNFNGGEYHLFEASVLNPDDVEATALLVDSEITNIIKSTRSENISKVWLNDSSSLFDLTGDINDNSISTSIFPNNGSTLYIGNDINFTEVSFVLDVQANADVDLVGFYCNESGWFDLDISDGTNGMQRTGSISFLTPEDRGECNSQINGETFSEGENFTYIAFQRTEPNVVITPNATLIELIIDSSLIRIGNVEGGLGADNSFSFINEELLGPGETHTTFFYTDSLGDKRIGSWLTSRANETASGNSNSFIIAPDNDLDDRLNMTETSNAVQRIKNYYGETSPIDFDSSQNRTGLFVLYALLTQQIHLSDGLGNGLLSVFGDANFFIRDGEEFDIVGDVHIQKTTIVPTGFLPGETVNLVNKDFEDGILNPFVLLTDSGDPDEWHVESNDLCFDSLCAVAGRIGTGLAQETIMGVNISTQPFDNLNLTFWVNTTGLNLNDFINVTINNNTGSGDVEIFSSVGTDVDQFVNYSLDSNFNNLSVLTLKYSCSVNLGNEFCSVDNILLQGNATEDTTSNVSRGDANLFLGFGTDGFNYDGSQVTGRSALNITADDINFVGNTTFTSVTETTLNVTESINVAENITVGDSVIGDRFFLGNGASIGYNSTCAFIFYNQSGDEISNLGCT